MGSRSSLLQGQYKVSLESVRYYPQTMKQTTTHLRTVNTRVRTLHMSTGSQKHYNISSLITTVCYAPLLGLCLKLTLVLRTTGKKVSISFL